MEAADYGVDTALDGVAAIELPAKSARRDVIVSDFRLPERVTGLDIVPRLRAVYGCAIPAFLAAAPDLLITHP
ncbi:MAG: CheY-like chemotaxis protein [Gammaproteobacteria bacterium]|jgi:CheY-like chemotaxis protein